MVSSLWQEGLCLIPASHRPSRCPEAGQLAFPDLQTLAPQPSLPDSLIIPQLARLPSPLLCEKGVDGGVRAEAQSVQALACLSGAGEQTGDPMPASSIETFGSQGSPTTTILSPIPRALWNLCCALPCDRWRLYSDPPRMAQPHTGGGWRWAGVWNQRGLSLRPIACQA